MPTSVKLDDLLEALVWVDNDYSDCKAFIDVATGAILTSTTFDDSESEEDLPEDIDNEEKYLPMPTSRDLELGSRVVFRFAEQELNADEKEWVFDIFRSKGAYRKFRSFLENRNYTKKWYAFEESEQRRALQEWCEQHGLEMI